MSTRLAGWYRKKIPHERRRDLHRRLPDGAWIRLLQASGYDRELAPLDASVLERIRSEPLELLGNADFLTHELLPAMGLSTHDAPHFYPQHLHGRVGRGVQSLQFPVQFGPYLALMARENVGTYLELGVDRGGTFAITVEILRRFQLQHAIAVDLFPPAIFEQWERPEAWFAQIDSHQPAFAEFLAQQPPIDLAFIDGDHSEAGVRSDFAVLRPHARILAFHDIAQEVFDRCPGVPSKAGPLEVATVWRSIKEQYAAEYEFHEFTEFYPHDLRVRLGIGVAIRRSAAPTESVGGGR